MPAANRIIRETHRDGAAWAAPGAELVQTFRSVGAVRLVSVDLAGPADVEDPYTADVDFSLRLENSDGRVVAERQVVGEQLLWERFGWMLEPAETQPPGEYRVVLSPRRHTIGWYRAESRPHGTDDGVSPLPVEGDASLDGEPLDGVLLVGVDTEPAPNPWFRRRFVLEKPAARASLSVAVLGTGVVRINGRTVGDEILGPAVTDYDRTVLYRTWDVAHLLRVGLNEIVVEAGRERYAARGGDTWGWHLAPWHSEPAAIALLEVVDPEGGIEVVRTGADWEAAAGPVECERLFRGEDWILGGGEPDWAPAAVVAGPKGHLRAATQPPMRALAPLPPVSTRVQPDGSLVLDFGTVMTGRLRCVVTGEPEASLHVRHGEELDAAGNVVCDNPLVAGEAQLDTLTLEGAVRDHTWEPLFGYRGFRWVQLHTTGTIDVSQVRAVPVVTVLDETGEFHCDAPLLEWIDTALARTFRNNLHGIPTDTPIYEKNGWTADAHLATEGLLHHFDLRASLYKWLDDHVDAQSSDGAVPQIVPTPGWGRSPDPSWSSSALFIPWYLYREYGDLEVLKSYAMMGRRLADALLRQTSDGLWRGRTWGDWLPPGHMAAPEGMTPIGTVMLVSALRHTADIFGELGDEPGAAYYTEAAADTARAYHRAYFDSGAGHYGIEGLPYRQSLNVLPLAFGVVPDEAVGTVRSSLVADLETRTGGHLDCGALAVRHLLPVLSEAGRDDLALTVLLQRTRPGWGAWFEDGESTLLESWDPDARSRNHYFLGSVAAWIQQRVGAMRLTAPGWRSFEIRPVKDDRITSGSIRHRTPLGNAAAAWERGPGGWSFHVTVPPGATATVIADGTRQEVPAGEHKFRVL
ncbi:family 78 glycoside hydrolase catalytic domain [Streptomyces mutabilis]|uniref:family 78 glycoside hydrolase catalytic domain n=1 Tax=Streptomyces mutabilis TaxID=67332 RepID=UPI003661FFD0